MDRIFVINEKSYKARKVDFNLVCDLDDIGIDLASLGKKQMSAVRAYFALCSGYDLQTAGAEIEQHIVKGGNLEDVITCFLKEVEESDFFQSLSKTKEEEVTTVQSKTSKKK